MTFLVVCWALIALAVGYLALALKLASEGLIPFLDVLTTRETVVLIAKIALHVIGWILLLIAIFGSEWDASIINRAWVDTMMKAFATLPAATIAALLTVVIVVFTPSSWDEDDLWMRIGNVLACMAATALTFGGFFLLTRWVVVPDGSLPWFIFHLGYAPLLLVSILFLAVAVGAGFGAGWTHRRAGGIRTVLFVSCLVATVILLEHHGPFSIPLEGVEPVEAEMVETELGLFGAIALFTAGALGILSPSTSTDHEG